jgi:hypothetical protein
MKEVIYTKAGAHHQQMQCLRMVNQVSFQDQNIIEL